MQQDYEQAVDHEGILIWVHKKTKSLSLLPHFSPFKFIVDDDGKVRDGESQVSFRPHLAA
jgi:hypothetical protein